MSEKRIVELKWKGTRSWETCNSHNICKDKVWKYPPYPVLRLTLLLSRLELNKVLFFFSNWETDVKTTLGFDLFEQLRQGKKFIISVS